MAIASPSTTDDDDTPDGRRSGGGNDRGAKLRVALVAGRYWPQGSSDTARRAMRLADHLHHHRINVRVLTPQIRGGGHSSKLISRGIPVHRLLATPRSQWTTGRYIRQWTTWMNEHCQDVDVIVAVGARDESIAAVDAAKSLATPVVVWPTMTFFESDIGHWRASSSTRRYVSTLRRADLFVADDSFERRMLVGEGIIDQRIEIMPTIWPSKLDANLASDLDRVAARKTLAAVNADLYADADQPVVMTTAAMVRGGPIEPFCQSLLPVAAALPNAKFWIIGDGPARSRLHSQLRGDGLRSVVAMPGTFNFADDICAAADIYVHLDSQPSAGWWHHSILAGLHQIVRRTEQNEAFLKSLIPQTRPSVTWCEADPVSIKAAMKDAIKTMTLAADWPPTTNKLLRDQKFHRLMNATAAWPTKIRQLAGGVQR